jgi:3-oxoacyl-[acyl-carrier protein] reductase
MGAAAVTPLVNSAPTSTPRRIEGRVALVTGSSSGLGRPAVLELARRGAHVVVNGRSDRAAAEEVAAEARGMGVRAIALMADVGVEEEVERMMDAALEEFGRIDILINNAAYRGAAPITELTTEQWRAAQAVNFDAPFFCTRRVVPGMIENNYGRIITVSGLNSIHGRDQWAHICGSKMGAFGMTRALAVELGRYNILVNHVVPGAMEFHPNLASLPVPRLGTAQELANLYAFLASEESGYITGQTIHLNGGEMRY